MTLKFNPSYWQVPRSSVGRASDRTMLRSVVRVQSLARGNLSFFSFFFLQHFFHHIFLLTDNKPLMSFFFDTHIKLITPVFFSSVFFCGISCHFCFIFHFSYHIFLLADNKSLMSFFVDTHITYKYDRIHFLPSVAMSNWGYGLVHEILKNKSKHVLLNWSWKFKSRELPLTNWAIPNHCKEISFVGHLKHDFKVQSHIPTSSPQLSG